MMRDLVEELGADVNRTDKNGFMSVFIAFDKGFLDVLRCLIQELGVDVDRARPDGRTLLYMAALNNNYELARFLVKECGANVNQADERGITPLMVAARNNNQAIIKHLVHEGAQVWAVSQDGTAAARLQAIGASAAEIAYLEVRECCANPDCNGLGGVKRCAVCKETRYCGMECSLEHWSVHRMSCQQLGD
jgi:hypothetical protein